MIVKVAPYLAPYNFNLEVGEVVANLSLALQRLKNEVVIFIPYSKDLAKLELKPEISLLRVAMDEAEEIVEELWLKSFSLAGDVKVYVVGDQKFFTDEPWQGDDLLRANLFCQSVLAALEKLAIKPKVINGYGWESSALPNLIQEHKYFKNTASVLTLCQDLSAVLTDQDKIKALKQGIALADKVVVASGRYAGELHDPHPEDVLATLLSARQEAPIGILAGLDYKTNDPLQDELIEHNYDEGLIKERPKNKGVLQKLTKLTASEGLLLSIVGPLNHLNGGEILLAAAPGLLEQGFQLIIAGDLEVNLAKAFSKLAKEYGGAIALKPQLDHEFLHHLVAGSDLMLALSPFASGPATDILLALRYGCIPLVYASGAAREIVEDYDPNREMGNGFIFEQFSAWAFFASVIRARELYRFPYDWGGLQENGMQARYFWHETAKQYIDVYREAISAKQPSKKKAKQKDDEDDDDDGEE